MVNTLALPILLLSGILLPMTLAPALAADRSDFNPFKHIVEALRAVFRGDFADADRGIGLRCWRLFLVVLGAWHRRVGCWRHRRSERRVVASAATLFRDRLLFATGG